MDLKPLALVLIVLAGAVLACGLGYLVAGLIAP